MLEKLLKKESLRLFVEGLFQDLKLPAQLQDEQGKVLVGNDLEGSSDRFKIQVEEKVWGWVVGDVSVRHIAGILSHLLALEQEKKTLAREVLSGYKELNLFYSLSQKMMQCTSFVEVARLSLQEIAKLTNCQEVCLYRLNEGSLEKVFSRGERQVFQALRPGEGIPGRVFDLGQPELINDVEQDTRYCKGQHPSTPLICVPMKVDGKLWGLICVSAFEGRVFHAQDLKLTSAIATHACSSVENVVLQEKRLEQDRVKNHLARYVSPHVVEGIMSSADADPLRPRRQDVSVLFSDIRDFTKMCEALNPEQMTSHLESYFTNMVEVIFSQGGTLDKFVGDMILTFFNAPKELVEHERKSVETAILMQKRLRQVEDTWVKEHFNVGMGLASGESVVGNIGPAAHCDYTVIGDAVNVGARLQAMAKGGQIFVSSSIYEATKEVFEYKSQGTLPLKGKKNCVDVYEVIY